MEEKVISLRTDLAERLELMASSQGRSIDEVVESLLAKQSAPPQSSNWALEVVKAMNSTDIDWQDMPHASATSRAQFEDHLFETWQRSQDARNRHE